MAKAKIIVVGEVEKFKVYEDGTINVLIKAETSKAVPKGLKELGPSTYSISINQKMWKKVSDKLEGNRILFTGEPKAAVSVKGVPFIVVNCFDISIVEKKVKESQCEPENNLPSKLIQPIKEVVQEIKPLKSKANVPENQTKMNRNKDFKSVALKYWRENHTDVQDIKVADLVLTEEEHLKGFYPSGFVNFKKHSFKKAIIVRPLDNGKFSLVSGFGNYVIAKILNFDTIPAIITDSTRQSLIVEALKEINLIENQVVSVTDNGV